MDMLGLPQPFNRAGRPGLLFGRPLLRVDEAPLCPLCLCCSRLRRAPEGRLVSIPSAIGALEVRQFRERGRKVMVRLTQGAAKGRIPLWYRDRESTALDGKVGFGRGALLSVASAVSRQRRSLGLLAALLELDRRQHRPCLIRRSTQFVARASPLVQRECRGRGRGLEDREFTERTVDLRTPKAKTVGRARDLYRRVVPPAMGARQERVEEVVSGRLA